MKRKLPINLQNYPSYCERCMEISMNKIIQLVKLERKLRQYVILCIFGDESHQKKMNFLFFYISFFFLSFLSVVSLTNRATSTYHISPK